jgi:hypothetical protein
MMAGMTTGTKWVGLALAVALGPAIALASCSGSSSTRAPRSGTSPITTATSPAGGTPSPSPQSSLTPAGTAPAEAGAGDICDQPASVSATVPTSIPAYPGAQLHLAYVSGNSGAFGYCTSANASAIASFYAQQLPGKGWTSIQTYTLGDHLQVTAAMGNTQLTMTAWPDSGQAGVTDVLITAQGL